MERVSYSAFTNFFPHKVNCKHETILLFELFSCHYYYFFSSGCSNDQNPPEHLKNIVSYPLFYHSVDGIDVSEPDLRKMLLDLASLPKCSVENIDSGMMSRKLDVNIQSGKNPILVRIKIYKNCITYDMAVVPGGPRLKTFRICDEKKIRLFFRNNSWAFPDTGKPK